MVGRVVKTIKFTHTGDADTLEQVVEMPEGGPVGYWEIWARRTSGEGNGYIESLYGAFDKSGENGYQLGNSYSNWTDSLEYVNSNDNLFPYLKIEADFEDDDETTEIELYIVCL